MVMTKVLHMNTGNGVSSYASNSTLQKVVILKERILLQNTIKDMYRVNFPKCFKVADLGCSSGQNTLFFVANVIDAVHDLCRKNQWIVPELDVSLNDLPDNDFNNVFKSLSLFYDNLKKGKGGSFVPCFVSGTPGSFYGRLFPSKSLHLVHSSSSIHWLSQVPERLENSKRDIYLSKRSPPDVFDAYTKQFQNDFSTFLRLRSLELVHGGRMLLTFVGRSIANPSSDNASDHFTLLADSLLEMVLEGTVEEADLFSFNIPIYYPYMDEVKAIIEKEGSFNLEMLDTFKVDWDASADNDSVFDNFTRAKVAARYIRAFMEPMLASHFGETLMEDLFTKFVNRMAKHLSVENAYYFNIIISLSKK